MSKEWKPGDVAMRTSAVDHHTLRTVATTCFIPAHQGQGLHWHHVGGGWDPMDIEDGPTYRPLVVIDPESLDDADRLMRFMRDRIESVTRKSVDDCALAALTGHMQAALREFAAPKPEVFRHYVGSKDGGLLTALCGKVWRRNAEANVDIRGDCPTCLSIVAEGWVS